MEDDSIQTSPGLPFPLGASYQGKGFNFAIYSEEPIESLVIAPLHSPKNIEYFPLLEKINRTGLIWHIFLQTDEKELLYAFTSNKSLIIDPYAKLIKTGKTWGKNSWTEKKYETQPLGLCYAEDDFDWEGDTPPNIAAKDLIIYEMHIRAFTQSSTARVKIPGTCKALIEKIPYLKQLGINAVELLPIFEFDETENRNKNPITNKPLYNFWGYSPLSFFSPMQRYAASEDPISALTEYKEMIKALHKANIEVILDVVYNHTGEGNELGPKISWKGLSETSYYLKNKSGEYLNFSGCGNTVNCNHPISSDMIIDSLRFWVTEMHVDGFRFDLASILSRDQDGIPVERAAIIQRITQDPILSSVKLISEPWDAVGLHEVGRFYKSVFSGAQIWMEWNDDFRSTVRQFIKGSPGFAGRFATKLCGSQDIYGTGGSPLNSINYVSCHDGFSLRDCVSYNAKHNEENGEGNRDGVQLFDTWNSGIEGETLDAHIEVLRQKQMKNFCLALLISQGIPMIHMGDEYGHTKRGNNNSWCQDNERNWFNWPELDSQASLVHFWKEMIKLRNNIPLLKRSTFFGPEDIIWHGKTPYSPDWDYNSHFIAYSLIDHDNHNDLFIAFNAQSSYTEIHLPDPPHGMHWKQIVNTGHLPPQDIHEVSSAHRHTSHDLKMAPYSSLLLIAQKV